MTSKLNFAGSLLLFLFATSFSYAADRYWVAPSSGNWNNSMNWSTNSGGAPGASVPGSSDQAIFNNGSVQNCTMDVTTYVGRITIQGNYGGIITVNPFIDLTMDIFTQASGVFSCADGNVDMYGGFNLSAGVFNATTGTMKIGSGFSRSGGTWAGRRGACACEARAERPAGCRGPVRR